MKRSILEDRQNISPNVVPIQNTFNLNEKPHNFMLVIEFCFVSLFLKNYISYGK